MPFSYKTDQFVVGGSSEQAGISFLPGGTGGHHKCITPSSLLECVLCCCVGYCCCCCCVVPNKTTARLAVNTLDWLYRDNSL